MKKLKHILGGAVMAGAVALSSVSVHAADDLAAGIAGLQSEWARIKYQEVNEDKQIAAIHRLEIAAHTLNVQFPDRAEPKIWEGIILATDASIDQGFSALGKLKDARDLFTAAIKQDDTALDGSGYTSLGSLYYQVPGWPISFRDDGEAEKLLKKALALNPDGIDPNFFYGDFLIKHKKVKEGKTYLQKALAAPARPNRPLADAGRRQEIRAALAEADQKRDDDTYSMN